MRPCNRNQELKHTTSVRKYLPRMPYRDKDSDKKKMRGYPNCKARERAYHVLRTGNRRRNGKIWTVMSFLHMVGTHLQKRRRIVEPLVFNPSPSKE